MNITERTEMAANSQLRRLISAGKAQGNQDLSLLEKIHVKVIIDPPTSQEIESNSTKGLCPCCGAEIKNQRPRIDLNTNTFLYRTHTIPLRKRSAELLEILIKRSPGVVTHDTIIRCLWGQNEPGHPAKNIQVQVCRLRQLLKGTGVSIVNIVDVGYRLAVDGFAS